MLFSQLRSDSESSCALYENFGFKPFISMPLQPPGSKDSVSFIALWHHMHRTEQEGLSKLICTASLAAEYIYSSVQLSQQHPGVSLSPLAIVRDVASFTEALFATAILRVMNPLRAVYLLQLIAEMISLATARSTAFVAPPLWGARPPFARCFSPLLRSGQHDVGDTS